LEELRSQLHSEGGGEAIAAKTPQRQAELKHSGKRFVLEAPWNRQGAEDVAEAGDADMIEARSSDSTVCDSDESSVDEGEGDESPQARIPATARSAGDEAAVTATPIPQATTPPSGGHADGSRHPRAAEVAATMAPRSEMGEKELPAGRFRAVLVRSGIEPDDFGIQTEDAPGGGLLVIAVGAIVGAQGAGLLPGDVILKVNGSFCTDWMPCARAGGARLELEVSRPPRSARPSFLVPKRRVRARASLYTHAE